MLRRWSCPTTLHPHRAHEPCLRAVCPKRLNSNGLPQLDSLTVFPLPNVTYSVVPTGAMANHASQWCVLRAFVTGFVVPLSHAFILLPAQLRSSPRSTSRESTVNDVSGARPLQDYYTRPSSSD
jgi:hypothetical protein